MERMRGKWIHTETDVHIAVLTIREDLAGLSVGQIVIGLVFGHSDCNTCSSRCKL